MICSDDDLEDNALIVNNLPLHNRVETFDEQNDYLLHNDAVIIKKNSEINAENESTVMEYKRGYVLRKCCFEPNGKKSKFKRFKFVLIAIFRFHLAGHLRLSCIIRYFNGPIYVFQLL